MILGFARSGGQFASRETQIRFEAKTVLGRLNGNDLVAIGFSAGYLYNVESTWSIGNLRITSQTTRPVTSNPGKQACFEQICAEDSPESGHSSIGF